VRRLRHDRIGRSRHVPQGQSDANDQRDDARGRCGESAYFFADEMPALAGWSFGPDEAAKVTAPALVVCGADSHPLFHEHVEMLAGMPPNAHTATAPGVNHLAPLTHPAELAATITEFLSEGMGR
jgi:pimeloyl-ACP methyl ester carboxylesterase